MYEEIEEDQKKYLPSESDTTPTAPVDALESYRARHQVVKRDSYKDDAAWDELGDKAMSVYRKGLTDEVDFKNQKATADTVMEIVGKKGGRRDAGDNGTTVVFSDQAVLNLTKGLQSLFQKDVTRNEDFKISPGSEE